MSSHAQPIAPDGPRWPVGAVIYQVYPRSFQDSNGDGVGDLPGITSRLDYLQDLGVNGLWLSPFYRSPMADFGYDVADHCAIDPLFGTMRDFDHLLSQAHARNLKVMIDLVPNHTSNTHQWFQQSRLSRTNAYANWYVWHEPAGVDSRGAPQPPNNWVNAFDGQSAWQWEPARGQFYLHSFGVGQPDLNWREPAVRDAIKQVMRFWLNHGVDGFRVDAVLWLSKDPQFRDDPVNPHYNPRTQSRKHRLLHTHSANNPQLYDYLHGLASVLDEPPYRAAPRFMVTEAYPDYDDPVHAYMRFYDHMDPAVAAPFNFEGLMLSWQAAPWREFLTKFHHALHQTKRAHAVASYAFGNHDRPRLASRLGSAVARAAALLQLTLPGMDFIYYGEELGMRDVPVPLNRVQDPAAQGDPRGMGRDPERAPMQWSAAPGGGFTTGQPWLPLASDFATHNVDSQRQDPRSFLSLYKTLIAERRHRPALCMGDIHIFDTGCPDLLGYTRRADASQCLVLVNFSNATTTCSNAPTPSQLLVSSDGKSTLAAAVRQQQPLRLRPYEAALFALPDAPRQQ